MRRYFLRRLVAIAAGLFTSGVIGLIVAIGGLPISTRVLGAALLTGSMAGLAFWMVRFWSLPSVRGAVSVWLAGCYIVGLASLVVGLFAAVVGASGDLLHWLCAALLVGEVGEHFGVRWVDGQGRWSVFGPPAK